MTPPTSDSPPSSVSDTASALAARARQNAIDGRAIIKAGQIIQPTVELIEFFEAVAAALEPRTDSHGTALPPISESDGAVYAGVERYRPPKNTPEEFELLRKCHAAAEGIDEGSPLKDYLGRDDIEAVVRLLLKFDQQLIDMVCGGESPTFIDRDRLEAENARLQSREAALVKRVEGLERDAARWRFAVHNGMPVRNQTALTADVDWVAVLGRKVYYGAGPGAAIDAALAEAAK